MSLILVAAFTVLMLLAIPVGHAADRRGGRHARSGRGSCR